MTLFPEPVRLAVSRIATRDGVTLDAIAASFRDMEGREPDRQELTATLAALRFTGEVRRDGDLYFWHETRSTGPELSAARRRQGMAIDIDLRTPAERELRDLGDLVRRYGAGWLVYPQPPAPDGPPVYISFAPGGLIANDAFDPDPLADFRWEAPSDRVRTAESPVAGAWTLVYLTEQPPSRPDCGPGWYLYGPDLTALPLGNDSVEAVLGRATTQVRAYVAVTRAAIQGQGTGSAVPDHIRAAIHAGHVAQVGIFCDECGSTYEGDFTGATREIRFAAARRYLEQHRGWLCGRRDVCPVCRTRQAS